MLSKFFPYAYVKSAFSIDYQKLYNNGYRGLIFDIDNTLVPHGADSVPEVDEFFRYIKSLGFKTLLLSNNDAARVERFKKNIDTLYVCDAEKPKKGGYKKAVEKLGTDKDKILCIGDQVFTDILGANLSGIASILVRYIGYGETKKIGIRRRVENIILALYGISKKYRDRLGDICINEVEEDIRKAV